MKLIIVGGVAGGTSAAARARRLSEDAEIILIDRRNHHIFQPLLYQVATSVLGSSDIAAPIRPSPTIPTFMTCSFLMQRTVKLHAKFG